MPKNKNKVARREGALQRLLVCDRQGPPSERNSGRRGYQEPDTRSEIEIATLRARLGHFQSDDELFDVEEEVFD